VLDSLLSVPLNARIFGNERVIIAATREAPLCRRRRLEQKGAHILILPSAPGGGADLKALLRELGRLGISHLLVEGGGRVAGSFISQGLFDRYMIFCSPLLIGGEKSKSSVSWPDRLNAARKKLGVEMSFRRVRSVGPDLLIEAAPARGL